MRVIQIVLASVMLGLSGMKLALPPDDWAGTSPDVYYVLVAAEFMIAWLVVLREPLPGFLLAILLASGFLAFDAGTGSCGCFGRVQELEAYKGIIAGGIGSMASAGVGLSLMRRRPPPRTLPGVTGRAARSVRAGSSCGP